MSKKKFSSVFPELLSSFAGAYSKGICQFKSYFRYKTINCHKVILDV